MAKPPVLSAFSKIKRGSLLMHHNTGTLLDVMTGSYLHNPQDGRYALNGGICVTNGTQGRGGLYKSTSLGGYMVNAWARAPGSSFLAWDTESTLTEQRLLGQIHGVDTPNKDNFTLTDTIRYPTIEEFFDQFRGIAEEKLKYYNDLLVDTPFADPHTGDKIKAPVPTFMMLDSWSEAKPGNVQNQILSKLEELEEGFKSKTSVSDKTVNTAAMNEGRVKTDVMTAMRQLGLRAGIYIGFTAHIGDKGPDMNGPMSGPPSKVLQYMKVTDKPKRVGSNFNFLIMSLLDCRGGRIVQNDADRTTLYPSKQFKISPTDLNEINQIIVRVKGGAGSGLTIPHLVSQARGIEPSLTCYHHLKGQKYWGMSGNPRRHELVLRPDQTIERTTAYDLFHQDAELARAVEILAHLNVLQNYNTFTKNPSVDIYMSPEKLAEKLLSDKHKNVVKDILQSRGWWSYDFYDQKQDPRQYLSIIDILSIVQNLK